MRRILLILFLVSVMMVASIGMANAESILFPYISNGAGVDTIISIINTQPQTGAGGINQLHYAYFTKAAGVVNEDINPCNEYNFFRPTTTNDLVTFAVGGSASLNSGNAMFGDPTNYNQGVGAPNFAHIHGADRRGILMVTTANNNVDLSAALGFTALDGEAQSYDIVNGAMWGYSALPSNSDGAAPGTAATRNSYSFHRPDGFCGGNTRQPLLEVNTIATPIPRLNIFPPNQFTNTLLVTPLMSNEGAMSANDCAYLILGAYTQNLKVTAVASRQHGGLFGLDDRNEQPVTGGIPNTVRCVARVDLVDVTGGALSPLNPGQALYTVGGWSYLDLVEPEAVAPAPALPAGLVATDWDSIVYGLKYGVITGLTGVINDGRVVCDWYDAGTAQGGCR